MRPEVVVANGEDSLENNECGEYKDNIPLSIKETVEEGVNMICDEHDIADFLESKVKIEHTLIEPFSEIETKSVQKLNDIQNVNNKTAEHVVGTSESQGLISNHCETCIVNVEETKSSLEIMLQERNNCENTENRIENGMYNTDILSTLPLPEGTVSPGNTKNINKEYSLDTTLDTDREKNRTVFSELNNVNIDCVPSCHKIRRTKDNAKQNNHEDGNESNINVLEFERSAAFFDIESEYVMSVILERNPLCEEKIYRKMVDTMEKPFVSLGQEDLHELQKQFKESQRSSFSTNNGNGKWYRLVYLPKKKFLCKLCRFTANNKCGIMVHIMKNHKEFIAKGNFIPAECMTPGKAPNSILYKCLECTYASMKEHMYLKHWSRHNPDELQTLSCASCPFKTKFKVDLAKHTKVHLGKYHKCNYCDFQSKQALYVKKHVRMMHKGHEVELLKCEKCSFQTKYPVSLQKHSRLHSASRKMYKCPLCPFETPNKETLKSSHNIVHLSEEAVNMHLCELCPYKTKRKNSLLKHMIRHKSNDEVKIYKCDFCTFETRGKSYISQHLILHQAPDKIVMHCCTMCSYQGKTAGLLRLHKRMHKKPEERKVHKCKECPYQTTFITNLYKHRERHKNIDELATFQCDKCVYCTVNKAALVSHIRNVHTRPEDIKWYKCNECDFQAKQPGNLRRHLICHMDPSKANKFKCDRCPFRTNKKHKLSNHKAKHSD